MLYVAWYTGIHLKEERLNFKSESYLLPCQRKSLNDAKWKAIMLLSPSLVALDELIISCWETNGTWLCFSLMPMVCFNCHACPWGTHIPAMKLYLNRHYGRRNRTKKKRRKERIQKHWDQVLNLTALSYESKLITWPVRKDQLLQHSILK